MTFDSCVRDVLLCDPTAELAESGLSAGWLIGTLLKNNVEFKTVLGAGTVSAISTKDISDGEGYASKVFKVTLKLTEANADEYAVIMKVPTRVKLDKLADDLDKDGVAGMKDFWDKLNYQDLHNVECAFYDAVRDVEDFPLPKVWHTHSTRADEGGVILMEDLSDVGCKAGFTQAFKAEQLRNIVRHFGALHAFQLCANEEEKAKIDAIPHRSTMLAMGSVSMFEGITAGVKEVREGALSELLKNLHPTETSNFMDYALYDRPLELGIPPLLCQCDSSGNNMFFKKSQDGSMSNEVCAFFDWQFAFKGNPFYDIAKLVVAFSDADVRREVEPRLVQEYYEHLKNGVEKRGGKELQFGLEQLQEAYELCKALAACSFVVFLPLLPVITKDKVSAGVSEALWEKWVLRAKFALVDGIESLKKYAPQFLVQQSVCSHNERSN
ncbi:calcium/calmodulin-dependent protein kinase type 1 [Aphelenchoides avenae]|nr:calcium/calmodulin-dependent protein kinase type 1 [Aphelenchus avenae]